MARSKRANIEAAFEEIGAAWAVTPAKCVLPGDGYGALPSYHVHPDRSEPHELSLLRFSTLDELRRWTELRIRIVRGELSEEQAERAMEAFWESVQD